MNRLTILGTAALAAAALTFPAAAIAMHMHHHHHMARAAAEAAGAAVGTAGAIATAPLAFDNGNYGAGWNGGRWDHGYAARNGIACTPGTWIKGDDGRRHVCQ